MMRHVKDQPPLEQGDGPIGLLMAPTRELIQQISKEIRKFCKILGMTCVAVFGGSGVANQITELKRGAEIVVCTPGRMIDLLVTSNGEATKGVELVIPLWLCHPAQVRDTLYPCHGILLAVLSYYAVHACHRQDY